VRKYLGLKVAELWSASKTTIITSNTPVRTNIITRGPWSKNKSALDVTDIPRYRFPRLCLESSKRDLPRAVSGTVDVDSLPVAGSGGMLYNLWFEKHKVHRCQFSTNNALFCLWRVGFLTWIGIERLRGRK
jgi:hypothetical protein